VAAEPIHVEPEDDVPAIIERIRRSTSDEVQLVLPSRARFGQSRFNFQLLRQYSTRLGKHVAIWSPDPAVLRLAEESGFGGFRPEPGGPVGMPVASRSPQRGPRPGARPAGGRPFPGRAPGPPAQPAGPYGAPGAVRAGAAPAGSGRAGGVSRIAGPGIAAQTAANARIRIGAVGRRLPANITQYQPTRFVLYGAAALQLNVINAAQINVAPGQHARIMH